MCVIAMSWAIRRLGMTPLYGGDALARVRLQTRLDDAFACLEEIRRQIATVEIAAVTNVSVTGLIELVTAQARANDSQSPI